MLRLFILLLMMLSLAAGEAVDPRGQPVATVNGEVITLGRLHDELLRREGSELLGELAGQALQTIDWRGLADDAVVLTVPAGSISRSAMIATLMPIHGANLLEELINIQVVRSALDRAGIVIDEALLDGEVARAERKLTQVLAKQGLPAMDLDTFLKDSKSTSLAEYRAQPGFQVLVAGLHALVKAEALAQVGEPALAERFARDRQRWALAEACDCSIIFVPFETTPGADGAMSVSPDERERRTAVVASIHRQIAAGQMPFGAAFRAYARSYDMDADTQGRIGWLRRDGTRDGRPGARVVPPKVVAAAFAQRGPFPVLLDPLVTEVGVEIVQVHGWRPASQPEFAAVRDRLVEALVEDELVARSAATLERLRGAAKLIKREDGAVEVDGRAISVREVQDAVLAREAPKAAAAELRRLVAASDLVAVAEDGEVLAGVGWTVLRQRFLAKLLAQHGAAVREDLIGLLLLRQGLASAGVVADDAAVTEELGRLERSYRRSPEAAKRDFRTFVASSYGAPPESLARDPAFRDLAATGLLLRRQVEFTTDDLHAFFAANAGLYRRPEAVDLAIIPLIYRTQPGEAPVAAEVERVHELSRAIHERLTAQPGDFARLWREVGRAGDPYAGADGRVGWIPRDGQRDNPAARRIPAAVVSAAFAAQGPWPCLLAPIANPRGIDLVMVHGRRSAEMPTFAEVAELVRRDCLEADWDQRLQAFVDGLRRAAVIDYADLAALIAEQERAAAALAP